MILTLAPTLTLEVSLTLTLALTRTLTLTLTLILTLTLTQVERALEAAGADVEAVEARLRRGEAAAGRGEAAGEAGSLRDTLAQLHGDATRLLAETVDSILTSEMSDARRDAARAGRKALGARLQHAIDRVEQLVRGLVRVYP